MNRSAAYISVLVSAYLAGMFYLQRQEPPGHGAVRARLPKATVLLVIAIAVPTTLQFVFPALLTTLERDYTKFVAGEWWRVITPLFVQDGGVGGSIFNLVSLFAVGQVAERLWGSSRWLVIFFTCGVLSEVIAFAWQPVGAGNSVATFGLATSSVVLCLAASRHWPVRIAAVLALITGAFLLLLRDIHGAAALLQQWAEGLTYMAYLNA